MPTSVPDSVSIFLGLKRDALFDIRIVDTDAPVYTTGYVSAVKITQNKRNK